MMPNNDPILAAGSWQGNNKIIDLESFGATAKVYKAWNSSLNQEVALKRYDLNEVSEKLKSRILEEPNLPIKNPDVAKAFEVFKEGNYLNAVMPFIEGKTLGDVLIERGQLNITPATYVVICLAKVSEEFHRHQIVLSDLKPDNIKIMTDGRVIILDITSWERIGYRPEVSGGTFPYAPQELFFKQLLSPATDTYTIGMTYFELLVGTDDLNELTTSHESELKQGVRKLDISQIRVAHPEAYTFISKAIEPNPHNRYQSSSEMLNDLLPYYESLTGTSATHQTVFSLITHMGNELSICAGHSIFGRQQIDPNNNYVSREQFELNFDGKALAIKNLSRINTTLVNERPARDWTKLNDGDVIKLANVILRVRAA